MLMWRPFSLAGQNIDIAWHSVRIIDNECLNMVLDVKKAFYFLIFSQGKGQVKPSLMLKLHDGPMLSTHSPQSHSFCLRRCRGWFVALPNQTSKQTKENTYMKLEKVMDNDQLQQTLFTCHVQSMNLWTAHTGSDAYWNMFDFMVIGVSVVEPRLFVMAACCLHLPTCPNSGHLGIICAKDVVLDFWARMLSPSMSTGQLRPDQLGWWGPSGWIWNRKWIGRQVRVERMNIWWDWWAYLIICVMYMLVRNLGRNSFDISRRTVYYIMIYKVDSSI